MLRTDSDLPEFATPDPFVVADVRLSLLAHVNRRNRFDKARQIAQIAQNERDIAAELEWMA